MRRLSLFFLLSLFLHGMVLLYLQSATPDFNLVQPQRSDLEVVLEKTVPAPQADQFTAVQQEAVPAPRKKTVARQISPEVSPEPTSSANTIQAAPVDKSLDPPDRAHFDPGVGEQNDTDQTGAQQGNALATLQASSKPGKDDNGTDLASKPDQLAPPAAYSVQTLAPAKLNMNVIRTEPNGKESRGSAVLTWQQQDQRYQLDIDAGLRILFVRVNLYQLHSRGQLSGTGIAPESVEEIRLRRAATATHFLYDKQQISFSASEKKIALEAGAQDKASVLLQLAAIGNADEKQFYPNRQITIQVAEEKEANLFTFVVLGMEDIDSHFGLQRTWHIVRPPKPGTYNSRLDIWFAPQLGWYPLQITNTESNGTVTVQSTTDITALPATIDKTNH